MEWQINSFLSREIAELCKAHLERAGIETDSISSESNGMQVFYDVYWLPDSLEQERIGLKIVCSHID